MEIARKAICEVCKTPIDTEKAYSLCVTRIRCECGSWYACIKEESYSYVLIKETK